MRKLVNEMANEEIVILKEEEKLYAEMEKQQEDQDNFGEIENAENWNRYEVAYWMESEVKLSEYMVAFMKAHVDGSILLSDLGSDYLCLELGVKRVHVQKIMRAIVELRDKIRKEWDESECFDVVPHLIMNDERAMDKIALLESQLSEKQKEMERMEKEYEERIQKLIGEISEKETIIKQAEDDGFIFGGDGKGNGSDDGEYTDDSSFDVSEATATDEEDAIGIYTTCDIYLYCIVCM